LSPDFTNAPFPNQSKLAIDPEVAVKMDVCPWHTGDTPANVGLEGEGKIVTKADVVSVQLPEVAVYMTRYVPLVLPDGRIFPEVGSIDKPKGNEVKVPASPEVVKLGLRTVVLASQMGEE
jgi:hypothetical protein